MNRAPTTKKTQFVGAPFMAPECIVPDHKTQFVGAYGHTPLRLHLVGGGMRSA